MWHETVLSLCGCPLVQLLLGVVYLSAGIATKLFKILYSIIALDIRLRCSSVGHPSFCSIDVTLEEYEIHEIQIWQLFFVLLQVKKCSAWCTETIQYWHTLR